MEYIKKDIDFNNVEPFAELKYDLLLVTTSDKVEDLKRFVVTHYQKFDQLSIETQLIPILYQTMIDHAIKCHNTVGLDVLWHGFEINNKHGVCPAYEHDVYIAAEYGDLVTFKHVLDRYLNCSTPNSQKSLNVNQLLHFSQRAKIYEQDFNKVTYFICVISGSLKEIYPICEINVTRTGNEKIIDENYKYKEKFKKGFEAFCRRMKTYKHINFSF
jgi:hypothetical protein